MKNISYRIGIIFVLLLSGCGPKESTTSLPSAPLSSLVGKSLKSDAIQGWLAAAGDPSDIKKSDDSVEYAFEEKGISLRFDADENLTAVILYAEGSDGFKQYQGELPYGLSFELGRSKIEKILGAPEGSAGSGLSDNLGLYPSKGISIRYNRGEIDEKNARMYTIAINKSL